ncbi:hypothetical protein LOK49_LG05G01450 [Camellia lanceoleosa]|uniref:Uncharacterized protein n=1 Tax=Camellia lanceoleosa TaxID=1840588 RepID=A0ACC0HPB0_9ERIC|nr:hypothetical protein LOK49_LG05G01450 [Camellia lanceoleosa]
MQAWSQLGPVPTQLSCESAVDVERVVRVVEHLRKQANFIFRVGIMYMSNDGELGQQMRSNMFSSGSGFCAVGCSLNLAFSSKLSSDVNRPFGDEITTSDSLTMPFRAARIASEEVGAQVLLGHRPNLLSVVLAITSSADMSRNNLKESSTDDSTIQLYKQLSFSYPSLQQPLFHERDTDNSVDFLYQNSLTTYQPVAASSSSTGLSVNP